MNILSGKTSLFTAMSVVAILSTGATVRAVPVVPNFQQGQMTTHTETTSEVVEVINSMDYNTGYTYSVSGHGVNLRRQHCPSGTEQQSVRAPASTTNSNGISSTWTGLNMGTRPTWSQSTSWRKFLVRRILHGTRSLEPYNYRENNDNSKRNRHHKYLYAIIALFVAAPVNAETVGGVSATAAPVANKAQ